MWEPTRADENKAASTTLTSFLAFLALALFGQVVIFFVARVVLVPIARALQARYGLSQVDYSDIIITLPLALQIVWVGLVLAWIMN